MEDASYSMEVMLLVP